MGRWFGSATAPWGQELRRASLGSWRLVTAALLVAVLIVGLAPGALAATGPIGSAAGFEDDDANLARDSTFLDWNSFAPITWNGSAPYQTASKSLGAGEWQFTGLTDAEKTDDTQFGSGVKQDNSCPSVTRGQVSNKTDFIRIYVAHKSV